MWNNNTQMLQSSIRANSGCVVAFIGRFPREERHPTNAQNAVVLAKELRGHESTRRAITEEKHTPNHTIPTTI
eukprot:gene13331-9164_t